MHQPSLLHLLRIKKRRISAERAFDDLFSYSQCVEVALIEREAMHEADRIASDLFYPDRIADDDIERFQNERRQLRLQFPQALRSAVLGLTHSVFETHFVEIAQTLADSRAIELPPRDRKTWPAKEFLANKLGITLDSESWATFGAYRTVRNAFMHNDGRVDLPLTGNPNVTQAAERIGAEVHGAQVVLTRACVAEFTHLCGGICLSLLRSGAGDA